MDSLISSLKRLTRREQEIMNCLAQGQSSKQIAATLFIAKNTVDNHRKNMLKRMGAKNTAELILKYVSREK